MRYICTSIVATLVLAGTTLAATINVPAVYTTIQAAVDAASDGDEVVVAPGTYTGTGDEVVNTLGKAITIKASGAPEETIIDGESARRVITCGSGEGPDTIIEGFTIMGGGGGGGGIYCGSYSSPTISGCTISGNTGFYYGGGIHCYQSTPTITNCTISDNTGIMDGGGISCTSSSPTIKGCTISNNTTSSPNNTSGGGGIYCHLYSSPTITNCTITGNNVDGYKYGTGGGIFCGSSSSPTISGCTISDNTAANGRGGGIYSISYSNPTITGCTISDNTAAYGGGIYCSMSSPTTLTECTISDNTANDGGGIYCSSSSSPTLTTTVVCGNDFDQIYPVDGWADNGGNTVADECPDDCTGDLDGNGVVGVDDLLALLASYQTNADGDCDGDGDTDVDDLLLLISAWGVCP